MASGVEHLSDDFWRREAPRVVAALARRWDDFAAAEDAAQDALQAAAAQWPTDGVPDDPLAWLIRVAHRRMIDQHRSAEARRVREQRTAIGAQAAAPPDPPETDDSLTVMMMCCHPALTPASQVALTLRAVAGLDTAQIAGVFVVPEATMAQRISRAKATIAEAGATFELPRGVEAADRLRALLHVLYLVFTEGHTHTGGDDLMAPDLGGEAIRLAGQLRAALPEEPEVAGLLALMLLTDARRPARTTADGALVPLADQDRGLWDAGLIEEGLTLIGDALPRGPVGQYQLQAAIAAVHAEAATADATDWPQILALYDLLREIGPGPIVDLNRAVALAEVEGPDAGLAATDELADHLDRHHRWHAVRGHLLERAGHGREAAEAFTTAAALTTTRAERDYLTLLASTARSRIVSSDVDAGRSAPTSVATGPTDRPESNQENR